MNSKEKERLLRKIYAKEALKKKKLERMQNDFTIYGIVDMDRNVIRCWQDSLDGLKAVSIELEPTILVAEVFERLITVKKDNKILIGGRGSGKSVTVNKILACLTKDKKLKVLCLREFAKDTKGSTYETLKEEIQTLGFSKFDIMERTIKHENGSEFTFNGLARNVEGIKSSNTVKIAFTDEAETLSENSIDVLLPSIRSEGCEIWFVANPKSAGDAFSKEFIIPYQRELERNNYYEDEDTMVIVANYTDNPFFTEKLERLRCKAFKTKSRAKYDHIWLGKFNDEVDDAIITAEMFDSAIDAHLNPLYAKMFKPKGVRIAAHDPSDLGDDPKGYAERHGSIIYNVCEKDNGNIADGSDWATKMAIANGCNLFTFDASGLGVGIRRDVNKDLKGLNIEIDEHWGGKTPDFKDDIYEGYDLDDRKNKKTNGDLFRNKRAQYYWRLRERFLNTYKLIIEGEYVDPDLCISLDSKTIENMQALRAEICRLPIKYNASGLIQMLDKPSMKRLGINSPNMSDSVAMTMVYPKATFKSTEEFFNKKINYEDVSIN